MYRTHAPRQSGRNHGRAPCARKVAHPGGGITCLSSALVQLRHHVLECSGPCHAHRVSRSALLGIQASHGGASGACSVASARYRRSGIGVCGEKDLGFLWYRGCEFAYEKQHVSPATTAWHMHGSVVDP